MKLINPIKVVLEKLKKRKELKEQEKYYHILKSGALFLRYINQDFERQKKDKLNRNERRRWQKEISQKGKFSPEFINFYKGQLDLILNYIKKEKNGKKVK